MTATETKHDISAIVDCLEQLTDDDLASMIGDSKRWTAHASQLQTLANLGRLEDRCFWSCRNARDKARETKRTDKDVPLIRTLFDLCESGRVKNRRRATCAISRLYVSQCRGDVYLYLGSDKASEKSGFHVGNYLWDAELPMIQAMRARGEILGIWVIRCIDDGKSWSSWTPPVRLGDAHDIPVWRRNWHPLDSEARKASFVCDDFAQSDYDAWRKQPPRPFISTSVLRQLVRRWRARSRA